MSLAGDLRPAIIAFLAGSIFGTVRVLQVVVLSWRKLYLLPSKFEVLQGR